MDQVVLTLGGRRWMCRRKTRGIKPRSGLSHSGERRGDENTSGKNQPLISAGVFSIISSAKFGRLGPFHFHGSRYLAFVSALLRTYGHLRPLLALSATLKVIGDFADAIV